MRRRWLPVLLLALAGCQTGRLPDPNDPNNPGVIQGDVLRTNVQAAAEGLFARVGTGEISDAEARAKLKEYVERMLADVKIDTVEPGEAWKYAEVYLAADRIPEARRLLETAVKAAPNQDRRVNDSLRLATAQAKMGEVERAVETARSVFDAPPSDKVPIVTAVLFEIAPAALGKGHDVAVAGLLEDAAEQARLAEVDPSTEPGKNFLNARRVHIRRCLRMAGDLYVAAGRQADAERVAGKM
jgi:tetratricopeptide (TPR) repeat protein